MKAEFSEVVVLTEDEKNQNLQGKEEINKNDSEQSNHKRYLDNWDVKTDELVARGHSMWHAHQLTEFERKIAEWPVAWGDDLIALIYGDFDPPTSELEVSNLGIIIEPEKITGSIITSARCVLKARVKIQEKSLSGVIDASSRLNTLLGILAVLNWGNSGSGWWSMMTHNWNGGVYATIESQRVQHVIEELKNLPVRVARNVRSALYWIREPRQLLWEGYRSDVLRVYAGYWNAFECLVEAVCQLRPPKMLSKAEKQAGIKAFIDARGGTLDAASVSECYKSYVDPGFVAKASHALNTCFPERGSQYVDECFRMKPRKDRLYDIRNAINHGDIDADDPRELLRVEDRHRRLWTIVFGMLGLIIPIDRPLDQD